MEIRIVSNGNLQVDNARIIFRNFTGEGSKFNREGDRNFALIIDSAEYAEMLQNEGWNVKIKPPREEGDDPFMYLPVKVKFNSRGPNIYVKSGNAMNKYDEDMVEAIDHMGISSCDMDIRAYDWNVNGKTGRTAYLDSMCVIQNVDRFASRFAPNNSNNSNDKLFDFEEDTL